MTAPHQHNIVGRYSILRCIESSLRVLPGGHFVFLHLLRSPRSVSHSSATVSESIKMSIPHILVRHSSNIYARSQPSSLSNSTNLCVELEGGHIVISKRTLILSIGLCAFLTCVSLLAATALLYREWSRRRQTKAAKAWGRKSRYENRISFMRKEIDTSFTRQYSGCLHNNPENPEMGSDSPVELMLPERLCEAPTTPAIPPQTAGKSKRKTNAMSLFFDEGHGMWLPKR